MEGARLEGWVGSEGVGVEEVNNGDGCKSAENGDQSESQLLRECKRALRRLTSTVCWGRFLLLQPQTSRIDVPRTCSLVHQPVQRLPVCIRAESSLSNLPLSVEELGCLFRELAEGVVGVVRAVHVDVPDESFEHKVERINDCSSVRGVDKG